MQEQKANLIQCLATNVTQKEKKKIDKIDK